MHCRSRVVKVVGGGVYKCTSAPVLSKVQAVVFEIHCRSPFIEGVGGGIYRCPAARVLSKMQWEESLNSSPLALNRRFCETDF